MNQKIRDIQSGIVDYFRKVDKENTTDTDYLTIETKIQLGKAELHRYWFDESACKKIKEEIKELENNQNILLKEGFI